MQMMMTTMMVDPHLDSPSRSPPNVPPKPCVHNIVIAITSCYVMFLYTGQSGNRSWSETSKTSEK